MKITYDVVRVYDEEEIPFITTEDYENAYDTAYEYVYGMGGQIKLVERHDGKAKKVTLFESDGYDFEIDDAEVTVTVILQLA